MVKPEQGKTEIIGFRVPPKILDAINRRVDASFMSVSDYLRHLVIKDLESSGLLKKECFVEKRKESNRLGC